MHLEPSFHTHCLENESSKARYAAWLRNLNHGTVRDYALRRRHDGCDVYEHGDAYDNEGTPPETCYGEWESSDFYRRGREAPYRAWHFLAHPVTWLSVCDICSRLGAEGAQCASRMEGIWSHTHTATGRAIRELFGIEYGHVCSKCLLRKDVQSTIARCNGEMYVEQLGYIARMRKESRVKLCNERGIPAEHRAFVETLAELSAVRKASNELKKLIKDTTNANKEN